jgi:hypothetical protein
MHPSRQKHPDISIVAIAIWASFQVSFNSSLLPPVHSCTQDTPSQQNSSLAILIPHFHAKVDVTRCDV